MNAPANIEVAWESVNRQKTGLEAIFCGSARAPDGSPGDVNVRFTGPGVNQFWSRTVTNFGSTFVAAPGVYRLLFDNTFSTCTQKQVTFRVVVTFR